MNLFFLIYAEIQLIYFEKYNFFLSSPKPVNLFNNRISTPTGHQSQSFLIDRHLPPVCHPKLHSQLQSQLLKISLWHILIFIYYLVTLICNSISHPPFLGPGLESWGGAQLSRVEKQSKQRAVSKCSRVHSFLDIFLNTLEQN